MRPCLSLTLAALALAAVSTTTLAQAQSFDFKDPKGVNAISFTLDSKLEPILGLASGITGTVTFDPQKPASLGGSISVDAGTLHTQNSRMTEVLHSEAWLNVKGFPKITFTFRDVARFRKLPDGSMEFSVIGDLTCLAVTKPLSLTVTATHLPGRLADRIPAMEGDLLVLRTGFSISRRDFGIQPDKDLDLVADDIQVAVAIVGICPKAKNEDQ